MEGRTLFISSASLWVLPLPIPKFVVSKYNSFSPMLRSFGSSHNSFSNFFPIFLVVRVRLVFFAAKNCLQRTPWKNTCKFFVVAFLVRSLLSQPLSMAKLPAGVDPSKLQLLHKHPGPLPNAIHHFLWHLKPLNIAKYWLFFLVK